jgi:hypothetical protein
VFTKGWRTVSGSWLPVTDGTRVAKGTSTGQTSAVMTVGSTSWADYVVSADLKASSKSEGKVLARYQDADNYYYCGLDANNTISMGKLYGGGVHEADRADFNHSANRFYNVAFTVKGGSLSCVVSDPVTSRTLTLRVDGWTYFTMGPIALLAFYPDAEFDNVKVVKA